MANETYRNVIKAFEEAERRRELDENSKDLRDGISTEASKEFNKLVFAAAQKIGEAGNATKAEELSEESYKKAAAYVQNQPILEAANIFHQNPIRTIEGMPKSTLERMVNTKPIVKNVDEDDKEVFDKYRAVRSIEEFMERYEDVKSIGSLKKEEQQFVRSAAAQGAQTAAIERERQRQNGLGYESTRLQNLAGALAGAVALTGDMEDDRTRGYAKVGLAEQAKKARKAYDESARSAGTDVYKIVRNTIARLANKPKAEFEKFFPIIYAAEKDKIGKDEDNNNDED